MVCSVFRLSAPLIPPLHEIRNWRIALVHFAQNRVMFYFNWSYRCLLDGFRDRIFQETNYPLKTECVLEAGWVHFYHTGLPVQFMLNFILSFFNKDSFWLKNNFFVVVERVGIPNVTWLRILGTPHLPISQAYRKQAEGKNFRAHSAFLSRALLL